MLNVSLILILLSVFCVSHTVYTLLILSRLLFIILFSITLNSFYEFFYKSCHIPTDLSKVISTQKRTYFFEGCFLVHGCCALDINQRLRTKKCVAKEINQRVIEVLLCFVLFKSTRLYSLDFRGLKTSYWQQ